tara:strand:- start:296 stop:757 length:462 start_codon:yes stop_codon:yes gene_type:complete
MLYRNPEQLKAILKPKERLLGLDVGAKTIGLAISDTTRLIASPYSTIQRTSFTKDALHLSNLVQQEIIGGIVIGLPINMNGSEGRRCQSVRQFAHNLFEYTKLPMVFWDERLSTVATERTLISADVSRQKRSRIIDKLAATYILQGALDSLAS